MLPFIAALIKSIQHSKKIIRDNHIDAVLGMGGFTSLPPVYAGHSLKLKTYIHDSNARPGRANILTSRFCNKIFIGLQPAAAYFNKPTHLTGTPARPEILNLPTRHQAAETFNLDPNKTTLLITGGSQGALRLNQLTAQAAPYLPDHIQILHIAGPGDYQRIKTENPVRRQAYHLIGFCDQMPSAYALADLVIARSGASTLTEIALAQLPSILVPYPYAADDHQTANAKVFADAGAAKLVQEKDLTADKLAELLSDLLTNPGALKQMATASQSLSIPDAAKQLVAAITS